VKVYDTGDYVYFVCEDAEEDAGVLDPVNNVSPAVNPSTREWLVPSITDCTYASMLGCDAPMDEWDGFDLRLYAQFRKLPQHFKLVCAVLDRQSLEPVGAVAVYTRDNCPKCGCAYCTGGIGALLEVADISTEEDE